MMNNTYSLIINQSERAWSFQWARTLFAIERKLSRKDKDVYLNKYSINIPAPILSISVDHNNGSEGSQSIESGNNGAGSKRFVPALMIIKRMNFTRAERKRLVVGYWQVCFLDFE